MVRLPRGGYDVSAQAAQYKKVTCASGLDRDMISSSSSSSRNSIGDFQTLYGYQDQRKGRDRSWERFRL
jgi:hypothetical protein